MIIMSINRLQLYLEGLTYREIERILGISHVSIMNWVKKYNIKRPYNSNYHPTYKILNATELGKLFSVIQKILKVQELLLQN